MSKAIAFLHGVASYVMSSAPSFIRPVSLVNRKQAPMIVPSWPKQVVKLDEAAARSFSRARA